MELEPEHIAELTRWHEDDAYADISIVDRCIEDVVNRIMQCATELHLCSFYVIQQAGSDPHPFTKEERDEQARKIVSKWVGDDFIKELFHEQYGYAKAVISARDGEAQTQHEIQESTH